MKAWNIHKIGEMKINANSIGSVIPVTKQVAAAAINIPFTFGRCAK
ncbi:hypothetical protein SDC9_137571 [bioreactor metagenome]|uniref:Uncharacterized protein n=1 Tax=bioreactor metagenome TaxID=1076179 RepID=A0A645DLX4_9ZZZZ